MNEASWKGRQIARDRKIYIYIYRGSHRHIETNREREREKEEERETDSETDMQRDRDRERARASVQSLGFLYNDRVSNEVCILRLPPNIYFKHWLLSQAMHTHAAGSAWVGAVREALPIANDLPPNHHHHLRPTGDRLKRSPSARVAPAESTKCSVGASEVWAGLYAKTRLTEENETRTWSSKLPDILTRNCQK